MNELLNVTGWIHGRKALSPQLKLAWGEVAAMKRLTPAILGSTDYESFRVALRRRATR